MPLSRDDSRWPVVVDAPSGRMTDEDVRSYNQARAARLARAERHVQVMDGRSGIRWSSRHRRMMAAFDQDNRETQRRYVAGVALVTSSATLRLVLAAIYRLTPSVCPRKACKSLDEASTWARSLLHDSPASR